MTQLTAATSARDWRRSLPGLARTSTPFLVWLCRVICNSLSRNPWTRESASRPAWNLTFERQLSRSTKLAFSYIGRYAHHLLARRDEVAFNNVVDPKSGMDWYTAGTMLEKQRQQGVPTASIAPIPFFENLFPSGLAGIMNSTFGLDPVCSGPNPGFVPTWSNTQTFYAMQSRRVSPSPCA